jgi:hypothetical protein
MMKNTCILIFKEMVMYPVGELNMSVVQYSGRIYSVDCLYQFYELEYGPYRLKEPKKIGVRKVIGAVRSALIRQFLSEALLFTLFAVIISIALIGLLLPLFNALTESK